MVPIFIALSWFIIGLVLTWIFEYFLKHNKKLKEKYYYNHKHIFGFHVHHSTYGLILLCVGVVLLILGEGTAALATFSAGLGIIVKHTFFDGRIIFVEKN